MQKHLTATTKGASFVPMNISECKRDTKEAKSTQKIPPDASETNISQCFAKDEKQS